MDAMLLVVEEIKGLCNVHASNHIHDDKVGVVRI